MIRIRVALPTRAQVRAWLMTSHTDDEDLTVDLADIHRQYAAREFEFQQAVEADSHILRCSAWPKRPVRRLHGLI